jgi:uncharacterized protein YjiS (DUF1127 family)
MHTKTWTATSRNISAPRRSSVGVLISALWHVVRAARARSLQRQHLIALSDHQLRDIGLIRSDVELEWKKPCWRD